MSLQRSTRRRWKSSRQRSWRSKTMRSTRGILLSLLLAIAAMPLLAQKHPNIELGFNADKLYQFTTLDAVNLFNGNLVVTIPMGQRYPVNDEFSYGLTLVYNSKVWDYRKSVVV